MWTEQYSVKIQSMDTQHKKLFTLLDDLLKAMQQGKGNDVLAQTLKGLTDYTVFHFTSEEALMKMHGYPGLESHKLEHKKLIDEVTTFKRNFESGQVTMSLKIMNFLKDWVTNHILKKDKEYGAYLNAKGVS